MNPACRYPGKVPFDDEASALRALKAQKRNGKENKKRLNTLHVYLCPDAPHWHIGHDRMKRGKLAYQ